MSEPQGYCLLNFPLFYSLGYFNQMHIYCGGSKYLCGQDIDARAVLNLVIPEGQRQCRACKEQFKILIAAAKQDRSGAE